MIRINSKTHLKQMVMGMIRRLTGSQYQIDLMYLNCESLREFHRLLIDLEADKADALLRTRRRRPRDPPQAREFLPLRQRKAR